MGDPLSVASGVVGIIAFGITCCQGLVTYYDTFSDQTQDVRKTTRSLKGLSDKLTKLQEVLQRHRFNADQKSLVEHIEGDISECEDYIKELDGELRKFDRPPSSSPQSIRALLKSRVRKFIYPFKEGTLLKLREAVQDIRDSLSFTISTLLLDTTSNVAENVTEMHDLIASWKIEDVNSKIRTWLKAPDPSSNHNNACKTRHAETGSWLVEGTSYSNWLKEERSFLWLNGFAGCGKTVLSSTVIQYTFAHCKSMSKAGLAFFYFDFEDTTKQNDEGFLRSFILQLSCQTQHNSLKTLHNTYKPGQPPVPALLRALSELLGQFEHVYLILDAVDECPVGSKRKAVLKSLSDIRKFDWPHLHLLVTSRDEPDIRKYLNPPENSDLSIQNPEMDADIRNFIVEHLRDDDDFEVWTKYHKEIKEKLIEKAGGMFRWVECQFRSLAECETLNDLRRALDSLPETLDATYARALNSLNSKRRILAYRTLALLCYSLRPLRVVELIDAIAVRVGDDQRFDTGDRLQGAERLKAICPGLLSISASELPKPYGSVWSGMPSDVDQREVRLAHFSVKEYLVSERITKLAPQFSIEQSPVHAIISEICLVYLLASKHVWRNNVDKKPDEEVNPDRHPLCLFPFGGYALEHWPNHAAMSNRQLEFRDLAVDLVTSDMTCHYETFGGVRQMSSVEREHGCPRQIKKHYDNLSLRNIHLRNPRIGRLFRAMAGLGHLNCQDIQQSIADEFLGLARQHGFSQSDISDMINYAIYQGLVSEHANVRSGHQNYEVLLNLDVHDATSKCFGQNLVEAVRRNLLDVVKKLIEGKLIPPSERASLATRTSDIWGPLGLAAACGCLEIVQYFVQLGADYDYKYGYHQRIAIMFAAEMRELNIVEFLARSVADLKDVRDNKNKTILMFAAKAGKLDVVEFLARSGADFKNVRDNKNKTILMFAVEAGQLDFVEFLVRSGADFKNVRDNKNKTVLMFAAKAGRLDVVEFLVRSGADFKDVRDNENKTVLMFAAETGKLDVVEFLVRSGADFKDVRDDENKSVLMFAVEAGQLDVVEFLVRSGADFKDVKDSKGRSTLHLAVDRYYYASLEVVKWLVENGADHNAVDNEGRTVVENLVYRKAESEKYGVGSYQNVEYRVIEDYLRSLPAPVSEPRSEENQFG